MQPSSKLSERALISHGFQVTLNQRVQGSSLCAPTNDFNYARFGTSLEAVPLLTYYYLTIVLAI
jgi:hypothetical protein